MGVRLITGMQGKHGSSDKDATTASQDAFGMEDIVWDYAALEEQIPELKERDLKNTRIKKISSRLADSIVTLGKTAKAELKIIEGNRNHLLVLTKAELQKVEPEILVEAIETVVLSLVEAIKFHRPSYQKLLKLLEERDVSQSELKEYKAKLQSLSEMLEETRHEKQTKLAAQQRTLKESETRIHQLESDLDKAKGKLLRLENEPSGLGSRRRIGGLTSEERSWDRKDRLSESAGFGGLTGSHVQPLLGTGTSGGLQQGAMAISTKEFREIKRLVDEEKGDLGLIATKNKQISSLKLLNKKKDSLLQKGRNISA